MKKECTEKFMAFYSYYREIKATSHLPCVLRKENIGEVSAGRRG